MLAAASRTRFRYFILKRVCKLIEHAWNTVRSWHEADNLTGLNICNERKIPGGRTLSGRAVS